MAEVSEEVMEVQKIGTELRKEIEGINADFKKQFAQLEGQLKEAGKPSEDTLEQFKGLEAKLVDMEKKHGEDIAKLATKLNRPDFGREAPKFEDLESQIKGALEGLVEKGFGTAIKDSKVVELKTGQKALMTKAVGDISNANLTGGYAARDIRNTVVYDPANPNRVREYVRIAPLSAPILEYPVETGSEGGVGFQTEGQAKSQMDFDLEMKSETPKTIAVFARSTRQSLDDIGYLANYLTTRLRDKWFDYEDNQIINGNGTGQQFKGIVNQGTGYVKTGGVSDVYYEYLVDSIAQLKTAHYRNLRVLLNPLDFMKLLIYKATPTGEYTHPSLAYGADGIYRIFGTPIAENSAVTRLTGIVGDFGQCELAIREALNLAVSYEEGSNFTTNKVTYRLEGREVLVISNPKAFRIVNFATISS